MATYRDLGDGTYEVDTPAGPLRTALGPDELGWAGYAAAPPPVDPMEGATASYGSEYGVGSLLDAPPVAPQAPPDAPTEQPGTAQAPGVAALVQGSQGPLQTPSTRQAQAAASAAFDAASGKPRLPDGAQEIELNIGPGGAAGGGLVGPDPDRPRYHTTKAQDVRASFQVQKGDEELRDETVDQLAELNIDDKLRMQEQADREEERGRRRSEMFQRDVVTPLERDEIEQRRRVQAIRTETAKRLGDIQREREAIDKLEIDPGKVYEGQEWTRALAFLSILAGGALQGMRGGSNPGLDGMNQVINRSIETQKENYQRRLQGLSARETEFERLMRIYGDPQLAEEELRNRHEALAAAYAKKFAMDVGTEDVKANLAAGMADLDRGLIQKRLELDQQLSDKVVENYQHVPGRTVQVGGRRPESPEARGRRVNIDGTPGYVLRSGDASKIQDANDQLSHLDAQLAEFQQLMSDPNVGPNERKAAADALSLRLGPAMAVLQGQGAMSESEQDNVKRALGDATEWVTLTPDQVQARIGGTRRFFGEKRKTLLQNNVYADPDATQPLFNRAPRVRRE